MVVNDMMVIPIIVKDVFETYCYFYINRQTNHGLVIDPGADAKKLLTIIKDSGWIIDGILLTHGHFDHIGAVKELHETLHIPYMIHKNGNVYLQDTYMNLSGLCNLDITLTNAQYLDNDERIEGTDLIVIHTPGHTPDSVIYYDGMNHIAFVGDTIFNGSIGNTQYPGGNEKELVNSIVQKVFTLPDETILFSGHSEWTTVAQEKRRYGYDTME